MLTVHALDVFYGRSQVLFGASLDVPENGLLCVMGRNGVGKSTLLNAVMGILKPARGTVRWGDRDITKLKPFERVRAGLAYVPQGHPVFPQLTVRENLAVAVESLGVDGTDEALDLFPRLKPLLNRRAGFLSGGQAQQLAFARALAGKPKLLLLDEPTEGIQPSIILEIEDAIGQLHRARGLSIVLVEQYVEFALRLADRYVVLDAGEVVASGAAKSLEDETVRRLLAV